MDIDLKNSIAQEVWSIDMSWWDINILDALVSSELTSSRGEAKKLIEQWWISIDGNQVKDINFIITKQNNIIQKGKKSLRIIL